MIDWCFPYISSVPVWSLPRVFRIWTIGRAATALTRTNARVKLVYSVENRLRPLKKLFEYPKVVVSQLGCNIQTA